MKRIGPRMDHVHTVVTGQPGIVQHELTRLVGPNGSTGYGYRTVMRALSAGLVRRESSTVATGQTCWRYYPVAAATEWN